jgi:hypothetical protein
MGPDELFVFQHFADHRTDPFAPLGAGICRQDIVTFGGEPFERISDLNLPTSIAARRATPANGACEVYQRELARP